MWNGSSYQNARGKNRIGGFRGKHRGGRYTPGFNRRGSFRPPPRSSHHEPPTIGENNGEELLSNRTGWSRLSPKRRPQSPPRRPQSAPRRPQSPPRRPQSPPRRPQSAPRRPQSPPRRTHSSPRRPQSASRKPQSSPRRLPPRRPQSPQRRLSPRRLSSPARRLSSPSPREQSPQRMSSSPPSRKQSPQRRPPSTPRRSSSHKQYFDREGWNELFEICSSLSANSTAKEKLRKKDLSVNDLLDILINDPKPYSAFFQLVTEFARISTCTIRIKELKEMFEFKMMTTNRVTVTSDQGVQLTPKQKLRILWLLGELNREEYGNCFNYFCEILKPIDVFSLFLRQHNQLSDSEYAELVAVFTFWKLVAPEAVIKQIDVLYCHAEKGLYNSTGNWESIRNYYYGTKPKSCGNVMPGKATTGNETLKGPEKSEVCKVTSPDDLSFSWTGLWEMCARLPTKQDDAYAHYWRFAEVLNGFLELSDPVPTFLVLMFELVKFCMDSFFLKKYKSLILGKAGYKSVHQPHEKMRLLWLLGEVHREQYDPCFQKLRNAINSSLVFSSFLRRHGHESFQPCEYQELASIYNFWKSVAPAVVQQIKLPSTGLMKDLHKNVVCFNSIESFYHKEVPKELPVVEVITIPDEEPQLTESNWETWDIPADPIPPEIFIPPTAPTPITIASRRPVPDSSNGKKYQTVKQFNEAIRNKKNLNHQPSSSKRQLPTIETQPCVPVPYYKEEKKWLDFWIRIPSLVRETYDIDDCYSKFTSGLSAFLSQPNPTEAFFEVMNQLVKLSKAPTFLEKARESLESKLKPKNGLSRNLKMRLLWILGDIHRKQYDSCFQDLRVTLTPSAWFSKYLDEFQVWQKTNAAFDELTTIFNFWKRVAPQSVVDSVVIQFSLKELKRDTVIKSIERYYRNVTNPSAELAEFQQDASAQSKKKGNLKKTLPIIRLPTELKFSKAQASMKLVDNLLGETVRKNVPSLVKAVFLDLLTYESRDYMEEFVTQLKKEILLSEKNAEKVRILWVIGRVFDPIFSQNLATMKEVIVKKEVAEKLFKHCVLAMSGDKLILEELRVIFHFWKSCVNREIILVLKGFMKSSSDRNFNKVLDTKNIIANVRVTHFYEGNYLDPNYVAVIQSKKRREDSKEEEIIILPQSPKEQAPSIAFSSGSVPRSTSNNCGSSALDKREVIGRKAAESTWEERLIKQPRKDSRVDVRINPKRLKTGPDVRLEGLGAIGITSFHKIPSYPRPVERSGETQLDDTCRTNATQIPLGQSSNKTGGSNQTANIPRTQLLPQVPPPTEQVSRLELFRRQMEQDPAVSSIKYNWGDSYPLPPRPTDTDSSYVNPNEDFVSQILDDNTRSWDIETAADGKYYFKVVKK